MGGVASVPTDSSRKIQVISAGFSRTGTLSMSLALEKLLDGPVCHGGTQLFGREDGYVKKWADVYRCQDDKQQRLKKLAEVTRGFVAIADVPGIQFVQEMMELYPDAKVIDVNREPAKWWDSVDAVQQYTQHRWLRGFLRPMPGWRWVPVIFDEMIERSLDLVDGREVYSAEPLEIHRQYVRDVVNTEKLFTVDIKDGWEPLCRILDKPVPPEPFPRSNDRDAVSKFARQVIVKTTLAWLGIVISIAVGVWTLLMLFSENLPRGPT